MKRIFVCSPLRGDVDGNIRKARELCAAVVRDGANPYAPHIFFTQFLNDGDLRERAIGMQCGHEWLGVCDELWSYSPDGKISGGMATEMALAKSLGIPVHVNPPAWRGL